MSLLGWIGVVVGAWVVVAVLVSLGFGRLMRRRDDPAPAGQVPVRQPQLAADSRLSVRDVDAARVWINTLRTQQLRLERRVELLELRAAQRPRWRPWWL